MNAALINPSLQLGYCTNVHAGTTLDEIKLNLRTHAVSVRERLIEFAAEKSNDFKPLWLNQNQSNYLGPDNQGLMPIGLWFAHQAASELKQQDGGKYLRDWLLDHGLVAYTINGFPYGDFHQPIVKHAVYRPTWEETARLDYTLSLAHLLADLLPDEVEQGSISTLPLGWPTDIQADQQKKKCGELLKQLVHRLARLELDTGKLIHLNLEPEPGCTLNTAEDVTDFFQKYLLGTVDDISTLAYLRVCHDVCHSAVMFEPQQHAFETYRKAGIQVGKVQLSSALACDFEKLASKDRALAFEALTVFAENRYLHQTSVCFDLDVDTNSSKYDLSKTNYCFYEDLPQALSNADPVNPKGNWRIHFHVPLHQTCLGPNGLLSTTQIEIGQCLKAIHTQDEIDHFEAETYAWDVLPEKERSTRLPDGISQELIWAQRKLEQHGLISL